MADTNTHLGRYELRTVLGRGGMGVVYEAVMHGPAGFRKDVALKVLNPNAVDDDTDARSALLREARLGALLSHPNLIATLELGEVDSQWYVAMELVRGPSISQLARARPLPAAAILDVGAQLCAGLGHIHTLRVDGQHAGLVHRDVKLGNVLLDRTGLVKLGDLGIARLASDRTPDTAGTLGYMAPEQLHGEADSRSDLFAVGVALYLLAARKRPFGVGRSALAATLDVETHLARADFLAPVEAAVPGLADIVATCLRRDPDDRFATAVALERALRSIGPDQVPSLTLSELLAEARPDLSSPAALGAQSANDSEAATVRLRAFETSAPVPLPETPDGFVGRKADGDALAAQLARSRLVTVCGPGGIGKTRLAVEVLRAVAPRAAYCDCATARTTDEVLAAVAASLRVPLTLGDPELQLMIALKRRSGLVLLLDTVEGCVEAAGTLVAQWLAEVPQLTVVATSRAPLRIRPEERIELHPLAVHEAVQLFAQRAGEGYDSSGPTEALVTELDCLPLAIELAAARTRLMSTEALLARLSDRFRVLKADRTDRPERQTSFRRSIDASWDLLAAWERSALAQLSVFVAGFTLRQAEQVLDLSAHNDAPWTLDVLEALLDHSLLRFDRSDDRFRLLNSIRAYASERLAEAGPEVVTRAERRHGEVFARMGHPDALATMESRDGASRRQTLMLAVNDLEAAASRAVARGDIDVAVEAGCAALWVRADRGPLAASAALATTWIAGLPDSPRSAELLAARAPILRRTGGTEQAIADLRQALARATDPVRLNWMRLSLGDLLAQSPDHPEGQRLAEQALAEAKRLGEPVQIGAARGSLGLAARRAGQPQQAKAHLLAAIEMLTSAGAAWRVALLQNTLGNVLRIQGHMPDARQAYQAALDWARSADRQATESLVLTNLATLEVEQGRPNAARRHVERALRMTRQTGNMRGEATGLGTLAIVLGLLGDNEGARDAYVKSLELHIAMKALAEQGGILSNLGALHVVTGDHKAAETRLAQAIAHNRRHGVARFEGYALGNLGVLRLEQGDPNEGARLLGEAVEVLQAIGDRRGIAALEHELSRVELARGNVATAAELADRAVDRLTAIDDQHELAKALTTQCLVHVAQGRADEANEALTRARSLVRKMGASAGSEVQLRVSAAAAALTG